MFMGDNRPLTVCQTDTKESIMFHHPTVDDIRAIPVTNRCVDDRYHLSMPNRAGYGPSHLTGTNGYFNDGGHTTTNRCMDDTAPMPMTDRWVGNQTPNTTSRKTNRYANMLRGPNFCYFRFLSNFL